MTFEIFNHLAICYEHLGQWEQAYRYKDSATVYSRREADEKFAQQLADFNVRYQTMEKDMEISRLHEQHTRNIIFFTAVFLILALLLLGLWLWQRQRRKQREAQLRIDTLEEERRRIARELHDGLCNDLLALEMQQATSPTATSQPELTARLRQLRLQTRTLSHQLMPPEFTHLTLAELLAHFAQNASRETALAITFTNQTENAEDASNQKPMQPDTSFELYRIVQEHTANVVKGGTAQQVNITLSPTALTISDDGRNDSDSSGNNINGIGLRTIRDRATSIGARISNSQAAGCNILTISFG